MNRHHLFGARARCAPAAVVALALAALLGFNIQTARAASWRGIEPLKSRRADVERVLGAPVKETRADGSLHFNVAGGRVTVFFVTAQFVSVKRLPPDLEGTVLQIVLQHERASDTPESLGLDKDPKRFEREAKGDVIVYRNLKDGLAYTFIGGKLSTTRYAVPAEQLARLSRKG